MSGGGFAECKREFVLFRRPVPNLAEGEDDFDDYENWDGDDDDWDALDGEAATDECPPGQSLTLLIWTCMHMGGGGGRDRLAFSRFPVSHNPL